MKRITNIGVLAALLLAGGCATKSRSISNSGYPGPYNFAEPPHRELDEFDVLGIERDQAISEEEIAKASAQAQRVGIKKGNTILLIQSGAIYPDGPMVTALEKSFHVIPFSGVAADPKSESSEQRRERTRNAVIITDSGSSTTVPLSAEKYETKKPVEKEAASYSRFLRLAAARAGAEAIICYWGILESEDERLVTKTISWLPGASWVVPDEREHLRIRIKMAVVDVRTGSWTILSPEPLETKAWSASSRRAAVDQKAVESMKAKAYQATVARLMAQNTD
jgi:hypothetical protein